MVSGPGPGPEHRGRPVIDGEILLDKLNNALIPKIPNEGTDAMSPMFLPDSELMRLLSEHEIRLELKDDQNLW